MIQPFGKFLECGRIVSLGSEEQSRARAAWVEGGTQGNAPPPNPRQKQRWTWTKGLTAPRRAEQSQSGTQESSAGDLRAQILGRNTLRLKA